MGAIDPGTLDGALRRRARHNVPLGEILRASGEIGARTLYRALARQHDTTLLEVGASRPDPRLIDRLGAPFCARTRLLPLRATGAVRLIATSRPHLFENHRAELERLCGPVGMVVAGERAIESALIAHRGHALVRRAESRVAREVSCRGLSGLALARGLGVVLLALAAALILSPASLFTCAAALALFVFAINTAVLVANTIFALRPLPAAAQKDDPVPIRLPQVTLLVPLHKERRIAGALLDRLDRLDYPRELLEICLVTEAGDTVTRQTLAATDLPPWIRCISVPPGTVTTKPRAMNFALDFCAGSIVGIYDAEDAPAPDQIMRMVCQFHRSPPDIACLQGRLNFYNPNASWISRCFAIEYSCWFNIMLPGLHRLGWPIPLGGTTLFFRRDVLEELGAWDAHNVTEDADLGLRLARRGYRTNLLDSTTLEEATCRATPWIRQRSRWLKGYAITWAVHMASPAALWRDLGAWRFLGVQVLFLGALLSSLLAPVLWSFWCLALAWPHPWGGAPEAAIVALAVAMAAGTLLSMANHLVGLRLTGAPVARAWLPVMQLYFLLGSVAILKGLADLIFRPFYWDKTAHGVSAPETGMTQEAR